VAAVDERAPTPPAPPPLSPADAAVEQAVARLLGVLADLRASGAGEE
jgi:hypothetical protein